MIEVETAGTLADGVAVDEWIAGLRRRFEQIEPEIGAFVPEAGRFERLEHQAKRLLLRYPDARNRPPLFGVPIGVKDIFHVEGMETRAGSPVPPAELAGPEATSVRRLLVAGALVFGKTVTTEFAYFAPRGTRNPADRERTPGGSSSGSAAAVAARLVPIALGTQTIGSVSRPASYCGVAGFKPSYDRISRHGVIPLAPSVDHVGVFAPTAFAAREAAAILMEQWQDRLPEAPPRLAVPAGPYLDRLAEGGRARFDKVCSQLVDGGRLLPRVPAFTDFDSIEGRHRRLVAGEAAAVHADWYPRYGDNYHARTRELIDTGLALAPGELERARNGRRMLRAGLTELMEREDVDLWVTPASQDVAPLGLESTGDPVMNLPWSHAGLPTVTLPAPTGDGELPFGLQLVGRFGADEELLAWAVEIERALES